MSYIRIKLKDLKQSNCVEYDGKKKNLADMFISQGYDVRKGAITVGLDNKIINGNHRQCLLLEEYGGEHVVVVKKKFITYNILKFTFIVLFVIFFPFFIVHQQIKKSY